MWQTTPRNEFTSIFTTVLVFLLGIVSLIFTFDLMSNQPKNTTVIAQESVEIAITEDGLMPQTINASVGIPVTWTNHRAKAVHLITGKIHQLYLPLLLDQQPVSRSKISGTEENSEVTLANSDLQPVIIFPGESYSMTFTLPGEFYYYLSEDISVHGKITIVPNPALTADLAVTINSDTSSVEPGNIVTYTIQYANLGNLFATEVLITNTLPEFLEFEPTASSPGWQYIPTDNLLVYPVGRLDANASHTIILVARLSQSIPFENPVLSNIVTIAGRETPFTEQVLDNNTSFAATSVLWQPNELCGEISENTTLTRADSPYHVTCDLTVPEGVLLTVEAGAAVKLAESRRIFVYGELEASGTPSEPIFFTSIKDDNIAGDTNLDGDFSSPLWGDWRNIVVAGSGTLTLNYANIRYGGYRNSTTYEGAVFGNPTTADHGVSLSIRNSTFENHDAHCISLQDTDNLTFSSITFINSLCSHTSRDGIDVDGDGVSNLFVDNSQFQNNGNAYQSSESIDFNSSGTITITNSTISNFEGWGVNINNAKQAYIANNIFSDSIVGMSCQAEDVTLVDNYFDNHQSSHGIINTQNRLNISGNETGNSPVKWLQLRGSINNDLALTTDFEVYNLSLTVGTNAHLIIESGVIVKMGTMVVDGTLQVQGTALHPVVLTSPADDSYGGDTNSDGDATNPAPGDWQYIDVRGHAEFNHAVLRYGGESTYSTQYAMIRGRAVGGTESVHVTVNNSILEFSKGYGISIEDTVTTQLSTLTVQNSTIRDCGLAGIDTTSENLDNIVINSNQILRNGANFATSGASGSGIRLNGAKAITITNNLIAENGFGNAYPGSGVIINGFETLYVGGNTFRHNASAGLLSSNTLTTQPVSIINNSFVDNIEGIYITGGDMVFSGNSFANNTVVHGRINVNGNLVFNANTASGIPRLLRLSGVLENDLHLSTGNGLDTLGISSLHIQPGATLTVDPGMTLKMFGMIHVYGQLDAEGTLELPVVFTSPQDDSYGGDTNGDGTATSPAPNDWNSILVWDGGNLVLDHALVLYGGNNDSPTYYYDDALVYAREGASISLTHSIFSHSELDGIHVETAQHTIENNEIVANARYGVSNGRPSELIVTAENNWWGDISGPAPFGAGNGVNYTLTWSGDCECQLIDAFVDFSPWLGQGSYRGNNISWQVFYADPVNTATGNYIYENTDIAIPTRSFPLAFIRFYNSTSAANGSLGYGWSHNYALRLHENVSDNVVIIQYGDGKEERFTWDGISYQPPAGSHSQLEQTTGVFRLTSKDKTVYFFNAEGRLASFADANQNSFSLSYTGGLLTSVFAPDGRALTFVYNQNDQILRVLDPASRSVQFTYDPNGNLVSATDLAGATTQFAYDTEHRLLSITDANGHAIVTNRYDTENRVVEQDDALGNTTAFLYGAVDNQTIVTDPLGRTMVYQYDSRLRLASAIDALGHTQTYTYDTDNNIVTETDKRGNVTQFAYDAYGNLLLITDTLGYTTTMAYDADHNLLQQTNGRGHTTQFAYDPQNNLTTITDPLGRTTTFTYDPYGQLLSQTNPRGYTTYFGYDSFGHRVVITDALGTVTTSQFDNVGRLLTKTNGLGYTTHYTYDAVNRLLTVTDPTGNISQTVYDLVGNKVRSISPNGGETVYTYDEKDHLTAVTDPLSRTITYAYDAVDNQTNVTSPGGELTQYTYNDLNQLVAITDPLGFTTTISFDENGNVLTTTNAVGATTTNVYDACNQLVQVTDALGNTTTYTYDAAGNRISHTDAKGHTTTYTFDPLNLLVSVTDPLSHTTAVDYDANGNQETVHKPDGNTITYHYDPLDRLTGIVYPESAIQYTYNALGQRTTMTDTVGITTYVYDPLQRMTEASTPHGTMAYAYDANGNRTRLELPDGHVLSYGYDLTNQLVTVNEATIGLTEYSYNDDGMQTSILYPNGVNAQFTYDAASRLTQITHASPISGTIDHIQYDHDAVGNRIVMTDTFGVTYYDYDALNRMVEARYPDGEVVSYAFDAANNRTVMTSTIHGVTTYSYNAADRLTYITNGTGVTPLNWDESGNLQSTGTTTYTFDALDRLVGVDNGVDTAVYKYDGNGVRLSATLNGIETQFLQDVASPLSNILQETRGGQTDTYFYGNDLITLWNANGDRYFYHHDGVGSTTSLSNAAGQWTDRYRYDAFGTIRQHLGTSDQNLTFSGEYFEDSFDLVYLRARYYDVQTGRFISSDDWPINIFQPQKINRYVFADNNPLRFIDPSGYTTRDTISGNSWPAVSSSQKLKYLEDLYKFDYGFGFDSWAFYEFAPRYLDWLWNSSRTSSKLARISNNVSAMGTVFDILSIIPNARGSASRIYKSSDNLEISQEITAFAVNSIVDLTTGPAASLLYARVPILNFSIRDILPDDSSFGQNLDLLFYAWDQDITGKQIIETAQALTYHHPKDTIRYLLIGAGILD